MIYDGRRASTAVQAGGAKPWSHGTRTTKAGAYGALTPVAIAADTVIPAPENLTLSKERVKLPEEGTVVYEGPGRDKPRNQESRPEERDDERDPQECEHRRGQRRDEVR